MQSGRSIADIDALQAQPYDSYLPARTVWEALELVEATGANILVALGPNPELEIWPRLQAVRTRCPGVRILAVGAADSADDFGMTEHDVMLNGFPLFHVAGTFVLWPVHPHGGRPTGAAHAAGHA